MGASRNRQTKYQLNIYLFSLNGGATQLESGSVSCLFVEDQDDEIHRYGGFNTHSLPFLSCERRYNVASRQTTIVESN